MFELILNPFAFEMEAVALPSAIRVKLSPVTPLAGILYRFVPSPLKEPDICPVAVNAPVISVLVLILKPFVLEIDAVDDPSAIWDKFNPVIPVAGIPYKPVPLPIKEPVNDPVV